MDFLPWGTSPNGVVTEVGFLREPGKRRKLVIRQTLPPQLLNGVIDQNDQMRHGHTISRAVRGNTQRHRVPLARLPEEFYWALRRQLGNPHRDPDAAKRWKAWLNDPGNRGFRTTEGII